MRKFSLYTALLVMLLVVCYKNHQHTAKICNGLYVEIFEVNPFGVNRDYLTDSLNFRMSIDRIDEEHETIRYICQADSILIIKTDHSSKNCGWITLEDGRTTVACDVDTIYRKSYSLSQLKHENNFE